MRLDARRSGENRGIRCDGGLLLNGYRATDRVSFWLLLGHVPLIVALAFLCSTWSEAVFWGGGAVAAGMFAAWRWRGTLPSRMTVGRRPAGDLGADHPPGGRDLAAA